KTDLMSAGTPLILAVGDGDYILPEGFDILIEKLGLKNVKVLKREKGKNHKIAILNAIGNCPLNTVIWLYGHGRGDRFYVSYEHNIKISPNDIAQILRKRAEKTNGNLNDIKLFASPCGSSEFFDECIEILSEDIEEGSINNLPTIVTSVHSDGDVRSGPGVLLDAVLNSLDPDDEALTMGHIEEAEETAFKRQDLGIYYGLDEKEIAGWKAALGLSDEDLKNIPVETLVHLRMIDLFEPLEKKGSRRVAGEKIGKGVVVQAGDSPSDIINTLRNSDIQVSSRTQDILPAIGRYFRYIRRIAPDKTKDLDYYKIEFRKNVKNYVFLAVDKIVVDVDLLDLDVDQRDILPFLIYVLGHEGSHALDSVVDEDTAQKLDIERFRSLSPSNRRSVLRVLTEMGADNEYLNRLRLVSTSYTVMPEFGEVMRDIEKALVEYKDSTKKEEEHGKSVLTQIKHLVYLAHGLLSDDQIGQFREILDNVADKGGDISKLLDWMLENTSMQYFSIADSWHTAPRTATGDGSWGKLYEKLSQDEKDKVYLIIERVKHIKEMVSAGHDILKKDYSKFKRSIYQNLSGKNLESATPDLKPGILEEKLKSYSVDDLMPEMIRPVSLGLVLHDYGKILKESVKDDERDTSPDADKHRVVGAYLADDLLSRIGLVEFDREAVRLLILRHDAFWCLYCYDRYDAFNNLTTPDLFLSDVDKTVRKLKGLRPDMSSEELRSNLLRMVAVVSIADVYASGDRYLSNSFINYITDFINTVESGEPLSVRTSKELDNEIAAVNKVKMFL
ncbi:hypothetical protein ACFLQ8_03670, partial [Candidatus Auribacterota bacterium]